MELESSRMQGACSSCTLGFITARRDTSSVAFPNLLVPKSDTATFRINFHAFVLLIIMIKKMDRVFFLIFTYGTKSFSSSYR